MRYNPASLPEEGRPVSDFRNLDVRLVLRADRRQEDERRSRPRGGRRISDRPPFGLSSSADVHDLWRVAEANARLSPTKPQTH